MKKFWLLFLILLLATLSLNAQGVLIITQYYEGASNDKWLELTNVGNASLDLTSPQLYLHLFSNAAADDPANSLPNNSYTLAGTLSVGQAVLFKNSSAVNPTYASGTAITVCNFNGDDLVIISTRAIRLMLVQLGPVERMFVETEQAGVLIYPILGQQVQ